MRKIKFLLSIILLSISLGFLSCTDDTDIDTNYQEGNLPKGLFILCEGLYGNNNSSLDFYNSDSNSVVLDLFNKVNNQGLGDTGNDMIEFNDYIFIAIKESATVQVINKNNGKLVKRIPILNNNGINRKPSRFAANTSMLYLCTVDGYVLEINPFTLSIGRIVKVGRNPEDICLSNNKLYITNSGGLDFNSPIGYDNTVSVVDPITMTEIMKIDVGDNPAFIKELRDGLIGLIVKGDYSNIKFKTINTLTDELVDSFEIPMLNFDVLDKNNIVYTNVDYFESMESKIKIFNFSSNTTNSVDFVSTPGIINQITAPYGINISISNNEVYITDARDFITSGKVFVFDLQGNYKYNINVGYLPSKVIIRN
ncbi:MAG: hypothetical protein M0O93_03160 [Bacteroidales bacterium]|nr:hypothetical protein [Bacteroidales bacterium]